MFMLMVNVKIKVSCSLKELAPSDAENDQSISDDLEKSPPPQFSKF